MPHKTHDILALGSCYVDTNLPQYPFNSEGIATNTELSGTAYEIVPGGSAVNFCRILAKLHLKTAFIGMAGTDKNGDILEDLLKQEDVDSYLIRQPHLLTNISFNMTNPSGDHIQLTAGTANAALKPDVVVPMLGRKLAQVSYLYMGGCFKLKAFAHSFGEIATIAKQQDVQVIVDHGRIPQDASTAMREAVKSLVTQSAYYLPSRKEFCTLWEVDTIEDGLRKLYEIAPHTKVIVKDDENGAYYMEDGKIHHVSTVKAAEVKVATGAGDSFNGGFISSIVRHNQLREAIEVGHKVAFAKVTGRR